MHLYRFINPSGVRANKSVCIIATNNVEAINAYVDRFFNGCYSIQLSKDFYRHNVIIMEVALNPLHDGVLIFNKIFAIDIN